jgi:hypothetical protein
MDNPQVPQMNLSPLLIFLADAGLVAVLAPVFTAARASVFLAGAAALAAVVFLARGFFSWLVAFSAISLLLIWGTIVATYILIEK